MMKIALLAALTLAAGAAQAQTVWRCGADGRTYADSPCPGGRAVMVADARSAADVQAAREVLARDRALMNSMVQQRHEHERELRANGSGLAGIKTEARVELKPKPAKAKGKKDHRLEASGTSPTIALAFR